jgi:hypothetical protein
MICKNCGGENVAVPRAMARLVIQHFAMDE